MSLLQRVQDKQLVDWLNTSSTVTVVIAPYVPGVSAAVATDVVDSWSIYCLHWTSWPPTWSTYNPCMIWVWAATSAIPRDTSFVQVNYAVAKFRSGGSKAYAPSVCYKPVSSVLQGIHAPANLLSVLSKLALLAQHHRIRQDTVGWDPKPSRYKFL